MTEPLTKNDAGGLIVVWEALSGDEVLRALATAPHVAGMWSGEAPYIHRYDLSSGTISEDNCGDRNTAAWVGKRLVNRIVFGEYIFHWQCLNQEGECATQAEAKEACDAILAREGWRFATVSGEEE